jgi:hypothetical protein
MVTILEIVRVPRNKENALDTAELGIMLIRVVYDEKGLR